MREGEGRVREGRGDRSLQIQICHVGCLLKALDFKIPKIGLKLTWTPSARSGQHFPIFLEVPESIYCHKINIILPDGTLEVPQLSS